ncbi:MAG: hypothetical protein K6G61_11020 [Solobacterium sp.]|nr:hypothetical protein [Solobacterium sp.]
MKIRRLLSILFIACTVLFAGCSSFTFDITQSGSSTEVRINNAEDGKEAETNWFSVGKNRKAVIASSLDQGKVEIEFVSAEVIAHMDAEDEVIPGDVVESVSIGTLGTIEVSIPAGNYIMRIRTVGKTSGSFTVKFEKE